MVKKEVCFFQTIISKITDRIESIVVTGKRQRKAKSMGPEFVQLGDPLYHSQYADDDDDSDNDGDVNDTRSRNSDSWFVSNKQKKKIESLLFWNKY